MTHFTSSLATDVTLTVSQSLTELVTHGLKSESQTQSETESQNSGQEPETSLWLGKKNAEYIQKPTLVLIKVCEYKIVFVRRISS